MVGARGFEPPTPWSRTSGKQRILLAGLAFLWIIVGLFPCCSGVFGPKLDSSFGMNPYSETISLGTLAVFIQPSVVSRPAPLMRVRVPSTRTLTRRSYLKYS